MLLLRKEPKTYSVDGTDERGHEQRIPKHQSRGKANH